MKYLLDTHTYLWWLGDPSRLSDRVRIALEDRSTAAYVSVVSYWEIAFKSSLGKLTLSRTVEQLEAELSGDGLTLLPIRVAHCGGVAGLPFHHRDPFDRLLVSQALQEGMTLLSCDPKLDAYGVARLW